MRFTKEIPKEINTEFVCTWQYEGNIDTNIFLTTEKEVLVFSEVTDSFEHKEEEVTFPWELAEEKGVNFVIYSE